MPNSIAEIINQINYNANFGYDKQILPNPAPEDDNQANGAYSNMLLEHIKKVQNCWFVDTGIETSNIYPMGSYAVAQYRNGAHEDKSLRDIAKDEFNVSRETLLKIDDIIRIHDRSRYSEDEFYGGVLNTGDPPKISQLKHFQRNAHEFSHYIYNPESGGIVVSDMPEEFIWIKIAVWCANCTTSLADYKYNTNYHKNPFQQFWGRDYEETNVEIDEDDNVIYDCEGPWLPNTVYMTAATMNRFITITSRWELACSLLPGSSRCHIA